jgi:hypothetical protein
MGPCVRNISLEFVREEAGFAPSCIICVAMWKARKALCTVVPRVGPKYGAAKMGVWHFQPSRVAKKDLQWLCNRHTT